MIRIKIKSPQKLKTNRSWERISAPNENTEEKNSNYGVVPVKKNIPIENYVYQIPKSTATLMVDWNKPDGIDKMVASNSVSALNLQYLALYNLDNLNSTSANKSIWALLESFLESNNHFDVVKLSKGKSDALMNSHEILDLLSHIVTNEIVIQDVKMSQNLLKRLIECFASTKSFTINSCKVAKVTESFKLDQTLDYQIQTMYLTKFAQSQLLVEEDEITLTNFVNALKESNLRNSLKRVYFSREDYNEAFLNKIFAGFQEVEVNLV